MRWLVLILLAGCASPERIAEIQRAEQEQAQAQRTAYRENLMASCENIGYQRNTDPWRNCIMQLHAQNQASQSAIGAALIQGYASQPRALPSCRSLPPGAAGYARAQGNCY